MRNRNVGSRLRKFGSAFGEFIDGKGFYLVILLCIVVVIATISVVSIRDYNKIAKSLSASNSILSSNNNMIQPEQNNKVSKNEENSTKIAEKTTEKAVVGQSAAVVKETDKTAGSASQNKPKSTSKSPVKAAEVKKSDTKAVQTVKREKTEDNIIKLSYPVYGKIEKEYADNKLVYSKTLAQWTTHTGIDIKSEAGTPVRAAMDGVVKSIKNDPGYGITIIIEHSGGIKTVYSNLSTTSMVKPGEKVKRGAAISGIGNSAGFECEDGPHLHFEVIKDGQFVNPESYLGVVK